MKTKVEKNYKIMIAGKERIISYVTLTESRFGGRYNIQDKEFHRISFFVSKEICFSEDVLSLDELEFLRNTFDFNQYEIADVLGLTNSALSKWKMFKKDKGLTLMESLVLKNFFKEQLIKMVEKIDQNKFLFDIILNEIKDSFIQSGKIDVNSIKQIEKIIIDKLVGTEFDIETSSPWTEKIIANSKIYDSKSIDYEMKNNEEPIDYSKEYMRSLKAIA